ncbi:LuxR family transcriptional regulator [Desulfonema ishimotonii]|uniref:LuxR family transcriptional regulator n=1 Tax=Desulfonema ishimotonii TaxID=45657 RepID=A0A401G247_9BACT|nr:PAS and helix-turn-helix domain-containing protein [Desulfonema ishimotonii]GBC63290.1 LuxR family transcriptional regulator [Desulfonema ishimotonii]
MKETLSNEELSKKIQILEKEMVRLKEAEHTLRLTERFAKSVLNSLSAHIAILDQNGVILETNQAWKAFAMSNKVENRPDMIGVNYLELCEFASGSSAEGAVNVASGIRRVIRGETEEFVVDYPCHSPAEKRWFYMRARRLAGPGMLKVVVSHENITALKLAEEELREREAELQRKTRNLDEANTALKVLLKHREEDRRELEEKVLTNVRELVTPYVEKLRETPMNSRQREFLNILGTHIEEIVSPFLHRMYSQYRNLTPQEIKIASLIKNGKMTKEIAGILGVSTSAIDFHRKNIRRKFGLNNKRVNLRSHLLSLK